MVFEQLSSDAQKAINEYCKNNNIEPTEEKLNELATFYDDFFYSEMVVTGATGVVAGYTTSQFITYTRNQILQNMLNQALEMAALYEQNLMKVSHNQVVSDLCRPFQNKIYWTIKEVKGYKELEPALWRSNGGLFHPNCRHQIYAYIPNESDPPVVDERSAEEIKQLYKDQQWANYLKRNKDKWRNRKDLAKSLENSGYPYEKDKWKEWVAREKEFLQTHPDLRS